MVLAFLRAIFTLYATVYIDDTFVFQKVEKISLVVAEKGEKDRRLFVCCCFVNFISTAMCSQGCLFD
jgi:hypothetical protein